MTTDVLTAASGRWREILEALAGLRPEQLSNRHQPCPACGGRDRFRFDDRDGNGSWFCNQCGGKDHLGGGGTGIDLLMRVRRWSFRQACEEVERHLGLEPGGSGRHRPQPVSTGTGNGGRPSSVTGLPGHGSRPWRQPEIPPADASPPLLDQGAIAQWCYRDAAGNQLFWIQRLCLGGKGRKAFLHRMWLDGGWHRPSRRDPFSCEWPAPRPLYGLPGLSERPEAPVLVVEGEGTADAAARLFPEHVVISWANGTNAIAKADWQPLAPLGLAGRAVTLWPDADAPGRKAMARLAALLSEQGCRVQLVEPPADMPQGWDLADADWTPRQAARQLAKAAQPWTPPATGAAGSGDDAPPPPAPASPRSAAPFLCLGFDGDSYYYQPHNTGQVMRLSRSAHTATNLVALASLSYWETLYPSKSGINWAAAASDLFEQQASIGVYDPERVRGRGAWLDEGRVIFHLGDRLNVDGRPCSVLQPPASRFFYEQARHLDGPGDLPLPDAEAMQIRYIAERFRWEMPASAHFLLGWLVLAPVCGALNWRPHIWLTGGAGTGKTTILKLFLRPLLGGVVQSATGGTTEAGLRGTLKSDAIPVVFDEFEQNEQKDKLIVQNVLALARIASSEGGKIYKGTTSGGANSFEIRSMFCVSSINVSLIQKADIDRFCVLGLRKDPMDKSEWLDFEREIATVATIDNGRALIHRTLQHLPVIIENARVLAQALGRRFGQRFGDQHGTLLAGAWSLEAAGGGHLNLVMADQWLDQMDWQHQQPDNTEADEIKCRDTILQQIVRHDIGAEASFGEMVRCVALQESLAGTLWDRLVPVLGRYGLRVFRAGHPLPDGERAEGHFLAVANANAQLDHVLRSTPWSGGAHRSALRRIDGAYLPKRVVHFAGIGTKRCVMVPIAAADLENV
jgi:putative DNA primase/helicase